MLVIDQEGEYAYVPGTKTLKTSSHPVYQARIEIALPKGSWLYAPSSGHNLARFQRSKQSQQTIDEFRKELSHYLARYSPDVKSQLVDRGGVTINMEIKDGVLS